MLFCCIHVIHISVKSHILFQLKAIIMFLNILVSILIFEHHREAHIFKRIINLNTSLISDNTTEQGL